MSIFFAKDKKERIEWYKKRVLVALALGIFGSTIATYETKTYTAGIIVLVLCLILMNLESIDLDLFVRKAERK